MVVHTQLCLTNILLTRMIRSCYDIRYIICEVFLIEVCVLFVFVVSDKMVEDMSALSLTPLSSSTSASGWDIELIPDSGTESGSSIRPMSGLKSCKCTAFSY